MEDDKYANSVRAVFAAGLANKVVRLLADEIDNHGQDPKNVRTAAAVLGLVLATVGDWSGTPEAFALEVLKMAGLATQKGVVTFRGKPGGR